MSEIGAISAAVEMNQRQIQNMLETLMIKQAAQADRALAAMLAENVQAPQKAQAADGSISIYV